MPCVVEDPPADISRLKSALNEATRAACEAVHLLTQAGVILKEASFLKVWYNKHRVADLQRSKEAAARIQQLEDEIASIKAGLAE